MTYPLIALAIGSALVGFLGVPPALGGEGSNRFEHWLEPILYKTPTELHDPIEYVVMTLSVVLAALVMYVAYQLYVYRKETQERLVEKIKPLYQASARKFWVDEFYEGVFVRGVTLGFSKIFWQTDTTVVDGGVNGSAWLTRFSAKLSGWSDTYIVDLIVNAVGFITRIFSIVFRAAQTGLTQNYALVIVTGLLAVTAAYFFWGS
jgi:NADH:ubiquinone oxidoreductase subunit 5 (subunit L)/multisubunit Na+/H+ antiporter MnhA subunit